MRLEARQTADGWAVEGLDDERGGAASTLLVLSDPFSFPVGPFLDDLRRAPPGAAPWSAAWPRRRRGPGGNRLVLDGAIHDDGAVGVLLDAAASPTTVVSQGCRPIGQPFIVTRAERNVLYELAGRARPGAAARDGGGAQPRADRALAASRACTAAS